MPYKSVYYGLDKSFTHIHCTQCLQWAQPHSIVHTYATDWHTYVIVGKYCELACMGSAKDYHTSIEQHSSGQIITSCNWELPQSTQ